ncbi:hypothetical protein GCM10028796_21420 [Ramlibacter monticola]|uniref:Uncharacterized protein n=1 Tax=Ramlibacter monticola TaxID=1926872 RepID=A0A936Z286_9BURK|nr:hypothetical protein [Ramlibacter monticola]MBL0392395.1 hypothetical protein [Ramlibacter monticola]
MPDSPALFDCPASSDDLLLAQGFTDFVRARLGRDLRQQVNATGEPQAVPDPDGGPALIYLMGLHPFPHALVTLDDPQASVSALGPPESSPEEQEALPALLAGMAQKLNEELQRREGDRQALQESDQQVNECADAAKCRAQAAMDRALQAGDWDAWLQATMEEEQARGAQREPAARNEGDSRDLK